VVVIGTLVVFLIGFSRLYLGVHYPTDVLAGYLAAPLWLVSVGTCVRAVDRAPGPENGRIEAQAALKDTLAVEIAPPRW
jgi:undecaprenyl-diphosphatase